MPALNRRYRKASSAACQDTLPARRSRSTRGSTRTTPSPQQDPQLSILVAIILWPDEWRREGDSNPRAPFGANGFQDRRFQPLTHPSASFPGRLETCKSISTSSRMLSNYSRFGQRTNDTAARSGSSTPGVAGTYGRGNRDRVRWFCHRGGHIRRNICAGVGR